MNTARNIFLGLFIISTLGVFVLFANFLLVTGYPVSATATPTPPPTRTVAVTENPDTIEPTVSPQNPESDPSSQNSTNVSYTALIGSILTSITSLVGFVTTTVITWRKEKRESSLADMQLKKLEAELEKSRLELERLKSSKTRKKRSEKKE